MKKTLIITIDFAPEVGGVAQYWKMVAERLDHNHFDLMTVENDKAEPFDTKQSYTIIRKSLFFKRIWPKWIKGIWQIYKQLESANYKQIIVGQVLPVGSMVYILHKLMHIPYSVQIYGMDLLMAKRSKRKTRLVKKILASAESVYVNSHIIGAITKEFGVSTYQVIYPVDATNVIVTKEEVNDLKKRYNLQGKQILLTLSRLVARKGQDKVIEAMKSLTKDYPNLIYIIAGSGEYQDTLQKLAEPLGDQVRFIGRVEHEDVARWMKLADIFIMPSRKMDYDVEGFGIVYIEANMQETPVVGGDSGGVVEAIEDRVSGLLVDPNSVEAITASIKTLLDNPELAKRLGEQGKHRAQRDFNLSKAIEPLIDTIT